MHSLNDVAAVVEHAANVFGVDGGREVRVTIVTTVFACLSTYSLKLNIFYSRERKNRPTLYTYLIQLFANKIGNIHGFKDDFLF